MGPDGVYTMFQLHGDDAAAAYTMRRRRGRATRRRTGICIFASRARLSLPSGRAKLGGKVVAGPFDVQTFDGWP